MNKDDIWLKRTNIYTIRVGGTMSIDACLNKILILFAQEVYLETNQ